MQSATRTQTGISLRQLLPRGQFVGSSDVLVRSCCGHWNECEPNDLFVAIADGDIDGHDHVGVAVERGACGVVSERLVAVRSPQCIVDDTRQAYGQICHALAGFPMRQVQTIGVTGSAGKTTTAHLIRSILEVAKGSVGMISSLEPLIAAKRTRETLLSAPGLAQSLANMYLHGHQYAVIEAPSKALAQHCLAGSEFDVAVVTNIRREHLDWHSTVHNYRQAKLRLFNYLKSTGFAVLNVDDPMTDSLLDEVQCPALTIGMHQAAEVTARIIEQTATNQTFLMTAGNQTAPIQTRLLGTHQIYNCLSAAAVALVLGIELPLIAQGIERIQCISGRLEPICCGQDFDVVLDISQTPSQLATALHTLKRQTRGRLICVATCHAQQTREERRQVGRILERSAARSILTTETLQPEPSYEPFHQMLDGFERVQSPHVSPDRMQAIELALSSARPGDTVLISGCGDLPVASIDQQGWQINDRDICKAWLYGQTQPTPPPSDRARIYRLDDFRDIN